MSERIMSVGEYVLGYFCLIPQHLEAKGQLWRLIDGQLALLPREDATDWPGWYESASLTSPRP
jgi:hypothetical protein